MRKSIIMLLLSACATNMMAQPRFFPAIKVEFEKTTAVRQYMKELQEGNPRFEQNKERYPVSVVTYYEFAGDTSRSIYKPGKDMPIDPRAWWRPVADKNIVYNDYKAGTTVTEKPVFEETLLLKDSLLKIKWKITGDLRTIAGFECRKAVGILNDSIAVFAFYTDELLVNGGPEGIHGLPGMILGVGIPRLHATWFATKVEVLDTNMKGVNPPSKGKKVDRISLLQKLAPLSENWGTYGKKLLLNFVI